MGDFSVIVAQVHEAAVAQPAILPSVDAIQSVTQKIRFRKSIDRLQWKH